MNGGIGARPSGSRPAATDRQECEAAWLALMSLPSMGPRRLWEVAAKDGPVMEWQRLRSGARPGEIDGKPEVHAAQVGAAAAIDPAEVWAAHARAGVGVTQHGDVAHPSLDLHDPHVPPVLLWRGNVEFGRTRPRVAIIGTRRASRAGMSLAQEFGRDLTGAGCDVVSGLALGIDAAAHRGALQIDGATPFAVVGCGLDVVYPRPNRVLWHEVAERGAIVSEYPLGTTPAPWRFPARNRILVALCDAVIVIESHERGGSLITAGIAGARGVPVLAVPGALRSPTSVGTNRLIADGCQPCLGVDDVLAAIGLTSAPTLPFDRDDERSSHRALSADEAAIVDAVGWVPHSVDELADACPGLGLGAFAVALAALLTSGMLAERDGRIERLR